MTIRAEYTDIVKYVSLKTSVSLYRTRKILSELSRNIKNRIYEGYDLQILEMLKIKYKSSKVNDKIIYQNKTYDFKHQVEDISKTLGIDELKVKEVLATYYTRINLLISEGYKVSIKSVCVIEPIAIKVTDFSDGQAKEIDGYKSGITISPVLCDSKSDKAVFTVLNKDGKTSEAEFTKDNLRFEVIILKGLNRPLKKISQLTELKKLGKEDETL